MTKRRKREVQRHIYATDVKLDKEKVLRAMNALRVGDKFAGGRAILRDLMVCGQYSELPINEETPEGPDALRLMLLYQDANSLMMGVLWQDVSYTFLRELERMGTYS